MENDIILPWDEIDEEEELMTALAEYGADIYDKLMYMKEAIEMSAYADKHPEKCSQYLSDIDEIIEKLESIWHD